ncbi:hypothetical protein D3C84_468940 [compost metagenome]
MVLLSSSSPSGEGCTFKLLKSISTVRIPNLTIRACFSSPTKEVQANSISKGPSLRSATKSGLKSPIHSSSLTDSKSHQELWSSESGRCPGCGGSCNPKFSFTTCLAYRCRKLSGITSQGVFCEACEKWCIRCCPLRAITDSSHSIHRHPQPRPRSTSLIETTRPLASTAIVIVIRLSSGVKKASRSKICGEKTSMNRHIPEIPVKTSYLSIA